jgi:hypothetical protein
LKSYVKFLQKNGTNRTDINIGKEIYYEGLACVIMETEKTCCLQADSLEKLVI